MSKERQDVVKSNEAEEFFSSTKTIAKPLPIKSSLALFFSTILISLSAGFVAGLIQDSLLPIDSQLINFSQSNQLDKKFDLSFLVDDNQRAGQTEQLLNSYVVGVYNKKTQASSLDSIYLPSDFLGTGMVVTSDGWILVPSAIINEKKVVFVVNKKVYEPVKSVVDPFNESTLVKIDASGLTPASYVKEDAVNNFDMAFVVKFNQQNGIEVIKSTIKSNNFAPRTDLKSYIRNTDVVDHWLTLNNQLPDNFKGALVINQSGLVVGQVNAKTTAITPHYYIVSTVNQFLDKSEVVVRPNLGVNYLQLDEVIGLVDQVSNGQTKGALITSDGLKVEAVKKDSSADKAGLLTGDIIVRVNDQEVMGVNSLTRLVQEYTPGTKINLNILRKGEKKDLEVVLE